MGKIPDLRTVAEQNGVEIISFRLPNADSMSTEVNGRAVVPVPAAGVYIVRCGAAATRVMVR